MIDTIIDLKAVIGKPEGPQLEYKAVLPPSTTVGRIMAAFANAEGGILVLGVSEKSSGNIDVIGLSDDFRASEVIGRALSQLSPQPNVKFGYQSYLDKKVYVVIVDKADSTVSFEGKIYRRVGDRNEEQSLTASTKSGIPQIAALFRTMEKLNRCSGAMSKFLEHYTGILNIVADQDKLLFPVDILTITTNPEGKILMRILFSSCADNFETYLSDLLYEIYLARPETLKSTSQITVKEVLECADMQDFILYVAKKRLSKLQRGSVKGFIVENEQISSLKALSEHEQETIEGIMQIRHLYAHRNGIIDEKFSNYFPNQYVQNQVHALTTSDFLNHFDYLLKAVAKIDGAAIVKYSLASV